MKKKFITSLKVVAAIFLGYVIFNVAVIAYLLITPVVQDYTSRIDFDSKSWKNEIQIEDQVRIKMVDNLLDTHELIGMKKSEIDTLLGKPTQTENFSDYDYWLGSERGFILMDSEWLVITFEDAIVTEARIAIY